MFDEIDLSNIQDENARQLIIRLMNVVEAVTTDLRNAQVEIQRLRDEINRLKGEQGKPKIKPNTPKPPQKNYSSEKERRKSKPRQKQAKKDKLEIHREQTLTVDQASLPTDAEFKGYEDVVVQDVIFQAENICFRKEKYWARSLGHTILAPLPLGYEGQYGPGLKALAVTLYFGGGMTEPKIQELYRNMGIQISAGQLSNLLVKDQDVFHAEKQEVCEAGLASSPFQHVDQTGTRVNGEESTLHHRLQPDVYQLQHHAAQGSRECAGCAAQRPGTPLSTERGSIGLSGVGASVEDDAHLVGGGVQ